MCKHTQEAAQGKGSRMMQDAGIVIFRVLLLATSYSCKCSKHAAVMLIMAVRSQLQLAGQGALVCSRSSIGRVHAYGIVNQRCFCHDVLRGWDTWAGGANRTAAEVALQLVV
jgi:hypothetical protein